MIRWLIAAIAAVLIACTAASTVAYIVNPKVWYCTMADETSCKSNP